VKHAATIRINSDPIGNRQDPFRRRTISIRFNDNHQLLAATLVSNFLPYVRGAVNERLVRP
jgi:hypothetical protein